MRRHLTTIFVGLFALLLIPQSAFAQNLRPEDTGFIKPRVGISFYLGDNEASPFNFNMDAYKVDGKFPYSLGGEIGYKFNPRYSLSLGYNFGDYVIINQFNADDQFREATEGLIEDSPSTRHTVQLIARYLLTDGRVAPYFHIGGNVTFGDSWTLRANPGDPDGVRVETEESSYTGYGPLLGFGLDFVVNRRTSFFIEATSNMTFADQAADGAVDEDDFTNAGVDVDGEFPADFLNQINFGLQINFKEACTPVMLTDLEGPASLVTDESGTFVATSNSEATAPVTYEWDFGDGMTAAGATATHSFDTAGTYDVSVTAMNCGATDTRTMRVAVEDACVPAEIVTMMANPQRADNRTAVAFSANVRGSTPVSYNWDFGDGNTSTSATPSHTFAAPGTYTVTLEVENCGGVVSRTMTIVVDEYIPAICQEITELNSVFFSQNSSTLTPEARAALQENQEILLECPNLCVRVEGLAGPGERNPQDLSADRARAVEQFYVDNGMAASRIMSVGLGRAQGVTSKKEGAAQYRRADSIPMQCTEMGDMNDM